MIVYIKVDVNGWHGCRHDILTWINDCLQAEFCKIEELCTGAAQCQLMDMLFPGAVNMLQLEFLYFD